jgi:hypothetical protein
MRVIRGGCDWSAGAGNRDRRSPRSARAAALKPIVTAAVLLASLALPSAGAGASVATAAGLPTMFATGRCVDTCRRVVPVYQVRPREISCQNAVGELAIRWSSWTDRAATGSGTATQVHMGVKSRQAVSVRVYDPRDGRFTRLKVMFGHGGSVTFTTVLQNSIWG